MRSRIAILSCLTLLGVSCQEKQKVIQTTTGDAVTDETSDLKDVSANSKAKPKPEVTDGTEDEEAAAAPVVIPSLVGSYKSNCHPAPTAPNAIVYFAMFSSTTATFFTNVYSDLQCVSLIGTLQVDTTYTITGPSALIPGAFNYDLVQTAVSQTPPMLANSYSIFKFDGPDHLFVGGTDGAANDGGTAATRFPKINEAFSYTRIK